MNTTNIRGWETNQQTQWNDPPLPPSWSVGGMEWETNLLLPQMAVALEHPCAAASANRLVSLWRALRSGIRQPPAGATHH